MCAFQMLQKRDMTLSPQQRRQQHHHERKPEVEDDELDDDEPLDLSTYRLRSNADCKIPHSNISSKTLDPSDEGRRDDIGTARNFRPITTRFGPPLHSYMTPGTAVPGNDPINLNLQESRPFPSGIPVPVTGISGTVLRTRGRERSLLTCSVCLKAFDRPSLLKRHTRTHTGEKPHVCDVCSKGFSTSSSLNTHRRIHSGEKPHQCPICGKRFTASSNLYYHRMTHNKEKPHKCLTCGKSFPTPGDLRSHQYVHSGSWPFNCPVCQRGFSKHTNLRNHLLLHSGDKPHSCGKCGKKFALACNLRAHFKTHEEEQQGPVEDNDRGPLGVGGMKCRKCNRRCVPITSNGAHDDLCQFCSSLPPAQPLNQRVKIELKSTRGRGTGNGAQDAGVRQSPREDKILTKRDPLPKTFPIDSHGRSIEEVRQPLNDGLERVGFHPPNPFLEQLISWNSQFVRETTTSEFVHQKFLESQFMASQFLFSSSPLPSSSSHHQLISSNFPRVDELIFPFTFPLPPPLLSLPRFIPTTDS